MTLKQNTGSKKKEMMPKHRAGGAAIKPKAGSTAVRFEGTCVHSDAGAGITHPEKHNAGSHDHKVRVHGGED